VMPKPPAGLGAPIMCVLLGKNFTGWLKGGGGATTGLVFAQRGNWLLVLLHVLSRN
jgi:hypothetical protein